MRTIWKLPHLAVSWFLRVISLFAALISFWAEFLQWLTWPNGLRAWHLIETLVIGLHKVYMLMHWTCLIEETLLDSSRNWISFYSIVTRTLDFLRLIAHYSELIFWSKYKIIRISSICFLFSRTIYAGTAYIKTHFIRHHCFICT